MQTIYRPRLDRVPVFNLLSVLEGKLLNEGEDSADLISGEVIIAPAPEPGKPPLLRYGLCRHLRSPARPHPPGAGAECELPGPVPDGAARGAAGIWRPGTCIISTPCDAYRAVRLIYHSTPIGRICRRKRLVSFHLDDLVDDVKEIVLKERASCYPILDEKEKIVGLLYQNHLLRPRRKRGGSGGP